MGVLLKLGTMEERKYRDITAYGATATDMPIATDSDEPYDPNCAEEVAVYWKAACITTVLQDGWLPSYAGK